MIRLTRQRTPQSVPARFTGKRRLELQKRLIEMRLSDDFDFDSSIWKTAKPQLRRESAGKCAYCESPTDSVAHGDVEHFRPKSVYWWLAYCYDNYLFACQICNQTFKGDNFPCRRRMSPPRVPAQHDRAIAFAARLTPDPLDEAAVDAFLRRAKTEGAYLVDPYNLDPARYFAWEPDETVREVVLVPASRSPQAARVVREAEQYFGLNREELRRWRWRAYDELMLLREVLDEPRLSARLRARTATRIKSISDPTSPYSAMVRYFVEAWRLPL